MTVSSALRRGKGGGDAGPAHGAMRAPAFRCAQTAGAERERARERARERERGLLLLVTENGSEHIQSGERLMPQGRREQQQQQQNKQTKNTSASLCSVVTRRVHHSM